MITTKTTPAPYPVSQALHEAAAIRYDRALDDLRKAREALAAAERAADVAEHELSLQEHIPGVPRYQVEGEHQ
jgi:hypothetical protein